MKPPDFDVKEKDIGLDAVVEITFGISLLLLFLEFKFFKFFFFVAYCKSNLILRLSSLNYCNTISEKNAALLHIHTCLMT